MSAFKEEDTIYKAIIRRDSPSVSAFLEKGELIPEFLYLQATNHDHLAVLQFMLNIEPEKRAYATRRAIGQGAIECTKFFLQTASFNDCKGFSNITPRRNNDAIAQLIQSAIIEKRARACHFKCVNSQAK